MVRVMHSKCSFAERAMSRTADHESTTCEKTRLQTNGRREMTPEMSSAYVTDSNTTTETSDSSSRLTASIASHVSCCSQFVSVLSMHVSEHLHEESLQRAKPWGLENPGKQKKLEATSTFPEQDSTADKNSTVSRDELYIVF